MDRDHTEEIFVTANDLFYIYMWLRKDGTPYYVGKGSNRRGYTNRNHNVKRPKSSHLIIVQRWESEEKALEMEKWWINFWGRKDVDTGILRNRTDGGEGITNPSPEFRESKRQALLGKRIGAGQIVSDFNKKATSKRFKGKKKSEAHRAKLSKAAKNRICTPETRKIHSLAHSGPKNGFFGRTHTPETCRKISETKKNKALLCSHN